jgi:hypothetical protein
VKGITGLLIAYATTVAKVRIKWMDNDCVQTKVKHPAKFIGTEMNSWADENEE